MIHMRVVQGNELIVDLPDWDYPVPRVGDYLFHPPLGSSREGVAGHVKTVGWRTHDRHPDGHFVMASPVYVEIHI